MKIKNQAPPKLSFRKKTAIILFGLFFLIIIFEIGLRIGGFIILSLQEYKNRLSLKQKGAYRIMCLGESTTQNQYPRFLEETFNQRNTGIKFSVIDKGLVGANTEVILSLLEENLDKYKPDMVLTMMGINDWRIKFYESIPNSDSSLFRNFRVYRLLKMIWRDILTKAKKSESYDLRDKQLFSKTKPSFPRVSLKEDFTKEKKPVLQEELANKATELNLKSDSEYLRLGRFYLKQNKYNEAEETFRKAIELNPENDSAYVRLGVVYKKQSRYTETEALFKKAIELNPKNSLAYLKLGRLYIEKLKYNEAERAIKQAIALNPEDDRVYAELGIVYRNQNRFADAEAALKKAIELNPENVKACGALEILYFMTGNSKLSQEYMEKTKELRKSLYKAASVKNYFKLKQILGKRNVRLVCMQYPMCSIESLKGIFKDREGVIFVDNEEIFRNVVRKFGYSTYFYDMFGGNFGHCTNKGNQLLAKNIADVILKEVFGR